MQNEAMDVPEIELPPERQMQLLLEREKDELANLEKQQKGEVDRMVYQMRGQSKKYVQQQISLLYERQEEDERRLKGRYYRQKMDLKERTIPYGPFMRDSSIRPDKNKADKAMLGDPHGKEFPAAAYKAIDDVNEEATMSDASDIFSSDESGTDIDEVANTLPRMSKFGTFAEKIKKGFNSTKRRLKKGVNLTRRGFGNMTTAAKLASRRLLGSKEYVDFRSDQEHATLHPDLKLFNAQTSAGQTVLVNANVIKSLGPHAIEKFLAPNLDNSTVVTNFLDLDSNSELYYIGITIDGKIIKIPLLVYKVQSVIEDSLDISDPLKRYITVDDLSLVPFGFNRDEGIFVVEPTNAPSVLNLKGMRDGMRIGIIEQISKYFKRGFMPVWKGNNPRLDEHRIWDDSTANELTRTAINEIIIKIAEEELRYKGLPPLKQGDKVELYQYDLNAPTPGNLDLVVKKGNIHAPNIRELLANYMFKLDEAKGQAYLGEIHPLEGLPPSKERRATDNVNNVLRRRWNDRIEANEQAKLEPTEKIPRREQSNKQREMAQARIRAIEAARQKNPSDRGGARTYKKTKRSKRHRKTKKRKNQLKR